MYVGSVKSVIGHLEGCAGLAGLIKALEAVRRGVLPPNMLFERLNPALQPYASKLRIPTEPKPWPTLPPATPRRASVNSFGFGGTNAHAIIESFDNARTSQAQEPAYGAVIATPLVLSASSEPSLRSQIANYHAKLQSLGDVQVDNVLFTLAQRRSQLTHRAFFSGRSLQALQAALGDASSVDKAITAGGQQDVISGKSRNRRILGVFTGQGAQWPTMGREILRASSLARDWMSRLEASLASLPEPPSWTLSEQCLADASSSRLIEAAVAQPLCTAVQLMVIELLRLAGVTFSCVIGHSSGEIAAAYASGFLHAEDAIRIAYYRGVCASLAGGPNGQSGLMMAVGMSYDEAADFCDEHFLGRIDVAASNAPASATLSGDEDAIKEAKDLLDSRGTFARLLLVDTAYHSLHMEPCAQPYLDYLDACNIQPLAGNPSCTWFSSVFGELVDPSTHSDALKGEYWKDNMVSPVLFTSAVELTADGTLPCDVAIEVGPHPALKGPFMQTFKQSTGAQIPYQSTLTRKVHDVEALSDTLGFLWSRLGKSAVELGAYASAFSVNIPSKIVATDLPSYSWDHQQSFWKESRKSANFRMRTQPPHPLLGVRSTDDIAQDMRWLNTLRLGDIPWLEGHKVEGQVIYPAAAYLVMAMEAAKTIDEARPVQMVELLNVSILNAIPLNEDDHGVETLFTLQLNESRTDSTSASWACYTPQGDGWKCNARGSLQVVFETSNSTFESLLPPRNVAEVSLNSVNMDRFYESLTEIGLDYTGDFKHLDSVARKSGFATATAKQMQNDELAAIIHPALLDSTFQSLFAAYSWPGDESLYAPFVPTTFKRLRLLGMEQIPHGASLTIDSFLTEASARELTADIDVFHTVSGQPLMQLEGLVCTSLLRPGPAQFKELYTRCEWEVDTSCGIASLGAHQSDTSEDLDLVDLCERLAYYYLRQLDQTVDRKEVSEMEWNHQRIFEWIDYLFPLIQSGTHPTIRKEWSTDQGAWLLEQAAKWPGQVDIELIIAVGQNLAAVVRKQTTMLEHMIKDDVLNRFYKTGLGFQRANGYLGRLAKQVAHRYPRMRILEIGAGTGGATKGVLESLGTAFESYTFTDISTGFFEKAAEAFSPWVSKMIFKPLNIENDPHEQGFQDASFDFIVASNVLHATKSLSKTMHNARRLLKPGGRLMLLEVTSDIVRVKLMMSGLSGWWLGGDDGRRYGPTITISEWDTLLRETGFSGVDSTVNDFVDSSRYMTSVMISQAVDSNVQVLRQPLSIPGDWTSGRSLTIVGGRNRDVASRVQERIGSIPGSAFSVHLVQSFEDVATAPATLPLTSIIVLEDLDEPILQDLTAKKLAGLQRTIHDARQLLWVSKGCHTRDPYANMSMGLCRGLGAEYPHVQLQHVDLESREVDAGVISAITEAMARLVFFTASLKTQQKAETVWTTETELRLDEQGRWLIPRILPDVRLNQQLNARKMPLHTEASAVTNVIEICRQGTELSVTEPVSSLKQRVLGSATDETRLITIKVTESLLWPICFDGNTESQLYLCYGHEDTKPDAGLLAVSERNSSNISVPRTACMPVSLKSSQTVATFLRKIAFTILAGKLLSGARPGAAVVLHEADDYMGAAVRFRAAQLGLRCLSTTSTSKAGAAKTQASTIFVHPRTPERGVHRLLPNDAQLFVDFGISTEEALWQNYLPAGCQRYGLRDMFTLQTESDVEAASVLVKLTKENILALDEFELPENQQATSHVVTASEISGKSIPNMHYASVVSYSPAVTTPVSTLVQPLKASLLFRPNRTYLLVGCTGGLGQALCRWMVSAGVTHLALLTRNPDKVDKPWLKELERLGANVRLFGVDVSDKEALTHVHDRVLREMPPVSGVANAAMVLADRSFGEAKVDDFARVFGPKVQGTLNLHELFRDHDQAKALDFFVMFSSLASIVGNRGQSNYVAANLFMSAIAEQRRHERLAASVMHIGMVLGVGYVSSTGTYEATLRQYNYMPISESDCKYHFLYTAAHISCST